MLPRTLEPEVMDEPEESAEYDAMDHTEVNRKFVDDLLASGPIGNDVLDLGTGTALIPIELCQREKHVRVMASDAASSMLEIAQYRIEVASLRGRIQLHQGDAKKLRFADEMFDLVMSNSLIHHLPDATSMVQELGRILKPGGKIFIRDLCRPQTSEEVESLVDLHAKEATENAKQLLRQSLHAALTVEEVRILAEILAWPSSTVEKTSDRHWTWCATKP